MKRTYRCTSPEESKIFRACWCLLQVGERHFFSHKDLVVTTPPSPQSVFPIAIIFWIFVLLCIHEEKWLFLALHWALMWTHIFWLLHWYMQGNVGIYFFITLFPLQQYSKRKNVILIRIWALQCYMAARLWGFLLFQPRNSILKGLFSFTSWEFSNSEAVSLLFSVLTLINCWLIHVKEP